MKSKKLTLFSVISLLSLFALSIGTNTVPVTAAATSFPNVDNITIAGWDLLAADINYELDDYLLTGTDGDSSIISTVVPGVEMLKDDTEVDLGESTFYSDSDIAYLQDRVFGNDTFNSGVATEDYAGDPDPTINNELQTRSQGSEIYGRATFASSNATSNQYVTWTSAYYYDYNDDGDYDDAQDRAYNPFINTQHVLYFCFQADFSDATDVGAYAGFDIDLEAGQTDYTIQIRLKPTSGDSVWSNLDASGENLATLTLYDTDASWIAMQIDLAELDDEDLGDSPDVKGLKSVDVIVNAITDQNIQVYNRNFAWFNSKLALTDATDDDDDWDLNSNGVPAGVWDDNDYLMTSIVEGATESYDSTVPLENEVSDGYVLGVPAMLINFEGLARIDIADNAAGSSEASAPSISSIWEVDASAFLTSVTFQLDTLSIDSLDTPTTYWVFTDFDHNMTLKESVLASADFNNWQDDLVSYTFEYVDYKSTVESAWDAADEDNEKVQYDFTNPSTTKGNLQNFEYSFYTQDDWSGVVEGVTPTPAVEEEPAGGFFGQGTTFDILVIVVVGGAIAAFAMWRRSK